MSDNTAMIPVNLEQLPSTQIGTDDQFAELAKGGDYIGRMQLYTKSKANMKGLIPSGHYGIPESGDDEITDLGTSVDLLPLARRPKAIDMTDMEALVISYDMESKEFKGIAAKSGLYCEYGPAFLVFERSTGHFLEFFCGNKSSRIEAKKIFPFLPLTQADIDAKAMAGNDVSYLKPHGPIPVTLTVKVPDNRRGTWYVPVVARCSSTFDIPLESSVVSEKITEFIMAGWEWSLDRIAREENRKTKPRASRQIKASATPVKYERTSTRKTKKATA